MNGDRLEGEIIKTLTGLKVLIRLHILSGLIYYFWNLKRLKRRCCTGIFLSKREVVMLEQMLQSLETMSQQ